MWNERYKEIPAQNIHPEVMIEILPKDPFKTSVNNSVVVEGILVNFHDTHN